MAAYGMHVSHIFCMRYQIDFRKKSLAAGKNEPIQEIPFQKLCTIIGEAVKNIPGNKSTYWYLSHRRYINLIFQNYCFLSGCISFVPLEFVFQPTDRQRLQNRICTLYFSVAPVFNFFSIIYTFNVEQWSPEIEQTDIPFLSSFQDK